MYSSLRGKNTISSSWFLDWAAEKKHIIVFLVFHMVDEHSFCICKRFEVAATRVSAEARLAKWSGGGEGMAECDRFDPMWQQRDSPAGWMQGGAGL
jgi:hypothetical protein